MSLGVCFTVSSLFVTIKYFRKFIDVKSHHNRQCCPFQDILSPIYFTFSIFQTSILYFSPLVQLSYKSDNKRKWHIRLDNSMESSNIINTMFQHMEAKWNCLRELISHLKTVAFCIKKCPVYSADWRVTLSVVLSKSIPESISG